MALHEPVLTLGGLHLAFCVGYLTFVAPHLTFVVPLITFVAPLITFVALHLTYERLFVPYLSNKLRHCQRDAPCSGLTN